MLTMFHHDVDERMLVEAVKVVHDVRRIKLLKDLTLTLNIKKISSSMSINRVRESERETMETRASVWFPPSIF